MAHERNIGVTTATVQKWVKLALKQKRDNGTLQLPLPKGFHDLCPGKQWIQSFIDRHKISRRIPEVYASARNKVTYDQYLNWFTSMKSYIIQNNWEDILADPTRNFNADESGIVLEERPRRVNI